MRLVLTRPEPDALNSAEKLKALGHDVLVAPLFQIVAVGAEQVDDADALVLSSKNAVTFMPPLWLERFKNKPVFAVGDRTKQAASALGFQQVHSADGDIHALAALIKASMPQGTRLLQIRGHEVIADLAQLLPQFSIAGRIVYAAEALPLPAALSAALEAHEVDGILHYSPRAARVFLEYFAKYASQITHFCLSAQIAEPLLKIGAPCQIAAAPNERALLNLLSP